MYVIPRFLLLPSVLLLTLCAAGLSKPAHAREFARWHTLTADQLKTLVESDAQPQALLEIAYIRALGQQQMPQALALLGAMRNRVHSADELMYWQATMCVLAIKNGDLAAASPNCEAMQTSLAEDIVHPSVAASAYASLGAWETRAGRAQQALERFDAGLEYAVKANDRSLLALLHHNRSLPLVSLGMPDLAVSSLELSNRYSDAIPADSQLPAILLHNLAFVQARRGAHESAVEEFRKVIAWAESLGQLSRGYIAVTQLAHSLTALDRPAEAIRVLEPWVEREDFLRTPDTHADALRALSEAHLASGDTAQAELRLLQGLDVAQGQDNPIRMAQLNLARVNLLVHTERFEEAVVRLTELQAATEPTTQLHAEALLLMSAVQHELGNHAAAYDFLRRYQQVDDITRSEDFDRRLSALRAANDLDLVNYELAVVRERERAAQQRSQQDRINRNIVIVAAMLVGVIGVMIFRRGLERREVKAQAVLTQQLQDTIAQRTEEIEAEMSLRIAAEKARAELEKRVAEDERLRTIGQLTGGVAHDFNNLLTVILLSADLLKSEHPEDAESLLEDIIHAGESGRATTRSLLAYARQQELQPETIELQQFLRQRTSLFKRTLGGAVDLDVVAEDTATIMADPGQLTTCLINLLFNATEAMHETGKVQIRLDTHDANRVDIVVSDTGPGMPPDVLDRATEPFFSTKTGAAGGSGLGLSMVYGFMKQSGGELGIRSKQDSQSRPDSGFGTSIILSFAAETEHSTANVASVDFGTVSRNGRTALLIEDQSAVRDVCRVALNRLGFEVLEAETGVEAMELILDGRPLDLVVTDALMPGGVSGLDIVSAVQSLYQELPVVLMSGGPIDPPENCVFLMKPFSLAELDATVRRLVLTAPVIELGAGS